MKKHFIYALIVSIILSSCFSTAIFAQDLAAPPEVMEISEDALIPEEEEAPDIVYEEAESPDFAAEQADEPDAIPELADPSAAEELTGAGGECGPNARWELSEGVLTIKGMGAIYDYNVGEMPWYSRKESILAIYIEEGITEIGVNAFYDLNYFETISLPETLKRIKAGAFGHAYYLNAIEIPASVTYIDSRAFYGCSILRDVFFFGDAPSFHAEAFEKITADIYYPSYQSDWNTVTGEQFGGRLTWKPVDQYYDLWVAGKRINSTNKDDILNDDGCMYYDPSQKTLYVSQTTFYSGYTIARDPSRTAATIYASGDLTIEGSITKMNVSVYTTKTLTVTNGELVIDKIAAEDFYLKDAHLKINSIGAKYIHLENSELRAELLQSIYTLGIKNCNVIISNGIPSYAVYSGICEIQDSVMEVAAPGGTAIYCYKEFSTSNSQLVSRGKDAGIISPCIKILEGNTITAAGNNGAIYCVEDEARMPIEIAPGYVFLAPKSPVIETYGIQVDDTYTSYVAMRPLKSSDSISIYHDDTEVSSIEVPTLGTAQLTLKYLDEYYVTGTWSSENSDIVSVDQSGQIEAKKYGKIKVSCDTGISTLSCDVQTRFYDVMDPKQSGYEKIYWGVENGIIGGFGGVYFGPEQPCTRLQFAIMLWRSQKKPAVSGTLNFPDTKSLKPGTDSYNAALWASKKGIINGFPDKTFGPDKNITREQIVIILWKLAGKPKATKPLPFKDTKNLDKNSTSYKAIAWASEAGIVNGFPDKTFRKNEDSKRNQIIIMIYRYVNR